MSNSLSRAASFTLAAGLGLSSVGCSTVAVGPTQATNTTNRVAAVDNPNVKIDRCADNGFLVLRANGYNVAQVARGNGTVQSQLVRTKTGGDFVIQYPYSIGVDNSKFSYLVGAIVGGAAGGAGIGRVVGAAVGASVLGPVFSATSDGLNAMLGNSQRDKVTKLAECLSDVAAMNGGIVAERASPNAQPPTGRPIYTVPDTRPGYGYQTTSPTYRILGPLLGQ